MSIGYRSFSPCRNRTCSFKTELPVGSYLAIQHLGLLILSCSMFPLCHPEYVQFTPPPHYSPSTSHEPPFEFLTSFSCSMICLLQLKTHVLVTPTETPLEMNYVLPTWKEPSLFRELCPNFPLSAQLPHHRRDTDNHHTKDRSICFPVSRLGVPSSGWGPDVFGVSAVLRLEFSLSELLLVRLLTGFCRRRPRITLA
jgi:hypothetical protein